MRSYLKTHRDPELEEALRNTEAAAARARKAGAAGQAADSPEMVARREHDGEAAAAYAALNAKNLEEAEARFKTILAKNPDDADALAGMGYVRMNQSNFGGAVSFLEQAKQDGSRDPGVDKGLATSRFWYTMGEGSIAMNENDLPTAEKQFRDALQMRPGSPEAMEGLAGTLMKAQEYAAAIPVYEQYVKLKPTSAIAWRGLFTAQYLSGNAALALTTEKRIPPAVRSQLMRDPEYLRNLASAYSAVGRDVDAQRVLRSALDLPFPEGAQGLKAETELQYAALLQQANHMDQASGLYRQVLEQDLSNVGAWQGLVRVQHAMHNDTQAQQTIESMPPSVYEQAMHDTGFLGTAASVYAAQNKPEVAQTLLEKAVAQQTNAGQKPSDSLELQLAGIYAQHGESQRSYNIYRQLLLTNSSNTDAWKGLLSALHSSGHDREALAQIQQIPPDTRKHLEGDVEYLQTVGGIYNGLGQPREAMIFLNRVQQKYAVAHAAPPADIDIQNAWLLFNGQNDTGLYRQLMILGSRNDLTDDQRQAVQTIWANWAVRRANQAAAQGYMKRSVAILNAAARAFPDNPGVYKALASGYLRAGLPKQAVAIFKTQDMTTASSSDYKAAIGSALAANDSKDAETWLRFALEQYPRDSQVLSLAARFEQARGDSNRAADYYKASLAAMPPPDPGAELADELSRPVAAMRPPTVAQQQDLASLLAPGTDATTAPGNVTVVDETPSRPYLPSYSNIYGQAPVVLSPDGAPTGSPVVPQYMRNPGYQSSPAYQQNLQQNQIMQRQGRPSQTSLGDYVPQASVSQPVMGQPTSTEDASYLTFQRQQIARATQQAQDHGWSGQAPGMSSDLAPGAVIASESAPPGTIYGPYVPYNVPQGIGVTPLYNASISQVEIVQGNGQTNDLVTSTSADIPAQAHYVPNAALQPGNAPVPAEIAAAEAASVRNQQSEPAARTLSLTPLGAPMAGQMVGQSRPAQPVDIAPVQQAQYTPNGPFAPPIGQTGRPSSLPAMDTTGETYHQDTANSALTLGQQYPQPQRAPVRRPVIRRSRRAAAAPAINAGPAYAPLYYPAVPTMMTDQPYPQPSGSFPMGTVPSDAQLVARNLPPLRGAWDPNANKEVGPPLTERQQTEMDLATLEGSYSAWVGGTAGIRVRSGEPGLYRLYDYEAPFEASFVASKAMRFTIIPKAVFLSSGTLDASQYGTNASSPQPYLGTLPATAINLPSGQYASGVGGEFQLATQNFGIAVGYTPYEFLVRNLIGRFRWKIGGGPVTFFAERDSVRDTQLSYAGLRDPGSISLTNSGNIWGGVVSTGGGIRFDSGDEKAGFYASVDGAEITGYHVLDNRKFEGTAGAYFRVKQFPGRGSLNIGGTFFGMHYDHNEIGLSYGQGGYFSPNAYFLAAMPITFTGYSGTRWHYVIAGALGVQTFQSDSAPIYPLDTSLQTGAMSGCALPALSAKTCGYYPVTSNTGANFDINSEVSYRYNEHWFIGGFAKANNTNNYTTGTIGFFVRYTFRPQQATEDYPTGLFPTDGFRPLRVP